MWKINCKILPVALHLVDVWRCEIENYVFYEYMNINADNRYIRIASKDKGIVYIKHLKKIIKRALALNRMKE